VRTLRARATARTDTQRVLQHARPQRLLVVCYGNIYRSPFVAERLRKILGDNTELRSAGFHSRADRTSPADFVTLSAHRGVDLSRHRSRVVAPQDLEWADLIVLMDRHNWAALARLNAPREKLVWLGACSESAGPLEIADPYGRDPAVVNLIVDQLLDASSALASRLAQQR
jgi:protein-tyrosine phosphatase